MDFVQFLQNEDGQICSPYAGKTTEGEWLEGTVSPDFLQKVFGECENLDECIQAAESEGLKLFFEHLKAQQ